MPRSSTLDEIGDLNAPHGSRKWAVAVLESIVVAIRDLNSSTRYAAAMIKSAREHGAWKALGYASFGLMLADKVGIDENVAEKIIHAPKDSKIRDVVPLAKHGQFGNGRPSRVDNIKSTRGGTSRDYQLRRLARDAPDILADLQAGKYPSVRQAAIAAGIVKVKTPYEVAIAALEKLDDEQWNMVVKWMNEQ